MNTYRTTSSYVLRRVWLLLPLGEAYWEQITQGIRDFFGQEEGKEGGLRESEQDGSAFPASSALSFFTIRQAD